MTIATPTRHGADAVTQIAILRGEGGPEEAKQDVTSRSSHAWRRVYQRADGCR